MKKTMAYKIGAGLLCFILLCGCANTNPNVTDPSGVTNPTEGGTATSWIVDHGTPIPQYTASAATMKNQQLAKELYDELLEVPPVDFTYDGAVFSQTLDQWERQEQAITDGKAVTYTHKASGIVVQLQYFLYADASAVEWKIRIENTGTENSPVIQDFCMLSASFETKGNTSFFYTKGGNASVQDFEPVSVNLKNGEDVAITCGGGRSSSGVMPFFNLYTAKDKGYIGAIGWSGQWRAEAKKENGTVSVRTRMTDSCFYLEAGESVMLPSMLLLPWEGDAQDGHNDLRRYILNHHTPQVAEGEIPVGPVSFGLWGNSGTDAVLGYTKAIANRQMGYDVLWIDAGWHGDGTKISQNTFDSMWFENAGTWTDIKDLYPNGIGEVGAFANEKGLGFLLWFEPERAFAGTQLVEEYPEWFLTSPHNADNFIFNLGDEEARQWLTEYIAGLIKEYGVNIYRQDFNIEPLDYWRAADGENRKGITEMKYIEGLYLYWEGLLERCPGLIIDNCASGGRRLDFESLSRSVSLFRSDYQCYTDTSTPESCQLQIYGLNYWLPLTGAASMGRTDTYNFRSNYGFSIQTPNVIGKYDEQIPLTQEFKKAQEYFLGDYYPLTECSFDQTGWFAYQLHRSDWNAGFICAFRRMQEDSDSITIKLSGLDPEATYRIVISDTGEEITATGEKLMESGFTIKIERKKDSRAIFYEKVG